MCFTTLVFGARAAGPRGSPALGEAAALAIGGEMPRRSHRAADSAAKLVAERGWPPAQTHQL